jgi:hypothetical protein
MSDWRLNIPIGSRIIIDDETNQYIFYGYNYNQTIASCFPCNSSSITESMIFIPIKAVLSICKPRNIEQDLKNMHISLHP